MWWFAVLNAGSPLYYLFLYHATLKEVTSQRAAVSKFRKEQRLSDSNAKLLEE